MEERGVGGGREGGERKGKGERRGREGRGGEQVEVYSYPNCAKAATSLYCASSNFNLPATVFMALI